MISHYSTASQLPIELRYFDIPREMWARTLLRARQLGALAVAAEVPWAWHAPAPGQIDLAGAAHPQRDLRGFVELCGELGLALTLRLAAGSPAWLGASPAERDSALRRWLAECTAALLPHQAPSGPIAALRLAGGEQHLAGWLRDAGWTIPVDPLPAATAHWPADGPATSLTTLLRSDGSARPAFWRAKVFHMLAGAAGPDFAAARAPADLALVEGARTEPLARRLAAAGMTFDWLGPASGEPERLAGYALVVAGEGAAIDRHPNLAWLGDPAAAPALALQLDDDISAEALGELLEARGGHARYAWADAPEIEVAVRYGAEHSYLSVRNCRDAPYNGLLAYRSAAGEVLHLHIGIGAERSALVMLRADEVAGAAFDGDGAEGGWLARGLTSSAVFNAGAGGVAPCGGGLLAAAPQSGRFQIRQSAGWAGARAYRLLLSGELIAARLQTDATHLLLPYTAEDERGQTDMYLVLPAHTSLSPEQSDYLAAALRARAAELRYAAALAGQAAPAAAPELDQAARALAASAGRIATPDDLVAAWRSAAASIAGALAALPGVDAAPIPAIDQIRRLAADAM
jgi:hypothetical protein